MEVYQVEKTEQTNLSEPIAVIETEARGLSAITVGSDKIYMGFCGSMVSGNIQIQTYSLEYEQLNAIELEVADNIVTEMVLCHNEQFLVCVHQAGLITVVNTEDMSFSTSAPFEEVHGKVESIWGVKRIDVEFVSIFEKLIFNTTNGLFSGMITADGEIQATEDAFFKDCNVTNACIIKDDLLLCTLND